MGLVRQHRRLARFAQIATLFRATAQHPPRPRHKQPRPHSHKRTRPQPSAHRPLLSRLLRRPSHHWRLPRPPPRPQHRRPQPRLPQRPLAGLRPPFVTSNSRRPRCVIFLMAYTPTLRTFARSSSAVIGPSSVSASVTRMWTWTETAASYPTPSASWQTGRMSWVRLS